MKHELTEARVGVLVNILNNTASRAGRIKDGLNQVFNDQLNLVDIQFLPLLEEIINGPPMMALAANINDLVSGPSDMETDGTNGQNYDNSGFGPMA
ncbi:hypothetical protein AgCh_004132 [Apium graveolens]